MEYVTNVDSKVDPVGAAETMLLLCDRLGIDDEVKPLCVKSVAAKAERGAQKPIVPAQLLRLRYTLDDSMVALSTIISGVRKWLPAETPIANMDKARGYRDSLDLPECVAVETTSTLGEASSTARAMRIADCLKAGLAKSAFVQAMDWVGLGRDIHLIFGIDGANMTVARCGLAMSCLAAPDAAHNDWRRFSVERFDWLPLTPPRAHVTCACGGGPRFSLSSCRAANRACESAPTSSISSRPSAGAQSLYLGANPGRTRACV
jgi:hypothetical protein